MTILSSQEKNILRGIKLYEVYKRPYVHFEDFYDKFIDTYLYKYKSVLMSFFSIYGNNYSVEQVEYLLLRDCFSLLFKITQELPPKYIKNQLDYVLGELRIIPIGIIEDNGTYINKIELF